MEKKSGGGQEEEEEREGGKKADGKRVRRRWTRGRRLGRENKIKEGNRWQFFTSFLKRGLGTLVERV